MQYLYSHFLTKTVSRSVHSVLSKSVLNSEEVYLTDMITGQESTKPFTREVFPSRHPPEPLPCSDSDDAISCEAGSGINSSESLIGLELFTENGAVQIGVKPKTEQSN